LGVQISNNGWKQTHSKHIKIHFSSINSFEDSCVGSLIFLQCRFWRFYFANLYSIIFERILVGLASKLKNIGLTIY